MGFSDERITDIYENLDNDLMARKIVNLVVKIKDTSIAPLIEKLDGYLHPSQTPLISFVELKRDHAILPKKQIIITENINDIIIIFFIFTPIYKIYFIIEKRLTIFEESKNPKIIAPYS